MFKGQNSDFSSVLKVKIGRILCVIIAQLIMQSDYHNLDEADASYELSRLKQSMEMVGFCSETQRRVFAVLSAVLHIGNVEFQPKKSTYHHDESVTVKNVAVVSIIASLLKVKEEVLHQALVSKRARASGETLVINYRMPEVFLIPIYSLLPSPPPLLLLLSLLSLLLLLLLRQFFFLKLFFFFFF